MISNLVTKFKKIINSNVFFVITVISFIIALAFISANRGGKDLKVGLFGVEQVLQKKSPYENPTDPDRPLFRYAPGFAILQYPFLLRAKQTTPFEFTNIIPSVVSWYLIKILCLFVTAWILLKIIPAPSWVLSFQNLKLAILMSLPMIGYELSNGQNKLIALFFMLAAILLFEKNRLFLSAIFYSLALTVYIPLLFFALYFTIRKKVKFILNFIAALLIVFVILPSFVFGFGFNFYLLKEWFLRTLKPFFITNSYATYIDLRDSSQSLPSAIGRIFVSGKTGNFSYHISPFFIHIIIRVFSAFIILLSCLAVWKEKINSKGLSYTIFLILALILPQYSIYYNWSWLLILYFVIFNYFGFNEVSLSHRRTLFSLVTISYISILLIGVHKLNYFSFIFWSTFALWLGMTVIQLKTEN